MLIARTPRITLGAWTLATSIGACVAWVLGMLPSTLAGLMAPAPTADAIPALPSSPPVWLMLLAAAMGLLLGSLLALPQWRLLRRFAPRAWRWIAANAAAWAVGMAMVFFGMDEVPWHGDTAGIALGVLVTCTLAGAAVGAVHGWVLQRMLRESETPAARATVQGTRAAFSRSI